MGSEVKQIKVGILSMGDMGAGMARLLVAHGFPVATNVEGRSTDTVQRADAAGVEKLPTDVELVLQCDIVLSVVPPRDAETTARRVFDALKGQTRSEPLYFADLNAISPSTCRRIAALCEGTDPPVRFIDGGILGGPPRPKSGADPGTNVSAGDASDPGWVRPRVPISGPWDLSAQQDQYGRLASVLNLHSISADIGAASGLKMCFSAVSKGFTAVATQSFTTARRLGVAEALGREMSHVLPAYLAMAEKGVGGMPPKAYRWVREMEEIATTMNEDGGWGRELFEGAAGVYRAVAEDEVLGQEKVGKRTRGTTVGDVAEVMAEGLARKRKKTE